MMKRTYSFAPRCLLPDLQPDRLAPGVQADHPDLAAPRRGPAGRAGLRPGAGRPRGGGWRGRNQRQHDHDQIAPRSRTQQTGVPVRRPQADLGEHQPGDALPHPANRLLRGSRLHPGRRGRRNLGFRVLHRQQWREELGLRVLLQQGQHLARRHRHPSSRLQDQRRPGGRGHRVLRFHAQVDDESRHRLGRHLGHPQRVPPQAEDLHRRRRRVPPDRVAGRRHRGRRRADRHRDRVGGQRREARRGAHDQRPGGHQRGLRRRGHRLPDRRQLRHHHPQGQQQGHRHLQDHADRRRPPGGGRAHHGGGQRQHPDLRQ